MLVQYIITTEPINEDPVNWNAKTKEEMLEKLKQYLTEDPNYVIEGLNKFTIEVRECQ